MENPSASIADDGEDKYIEKPLISINSAVADGKGGFRALPFIIANGALEKIASQGLGPSMIIYLTRNYQLKSAYASNVIFLWSAASNFTPVIGAFLADSYFGRFTMIAIGCIVSFLGMFLLWLTAMIPQARPFCDELSGHCEAPTTPQLLLLYSSFTLMSVGSGGIQASSMAFGADQLDNRNKSKKSGIFGSFFTWFYISSTIGILIGMSCIVYIQEHYGWKVGFGIPAVLMFLSTVIFLLASPFYVKSKPNTSLCTGLVQVIVASYKKRRLQLPSVGTYDIIDMYHHKNGSPIIEPSDKLRFLNKACIIVNSSEELASDPWSLCTVDQVEELKVLIRIIPLWSTGILVAVALNQGSFAVLQLASMDRHLTPHFEVPAASFNVFIIVSLITWTTLYDYLFIPLASKIREKPTHLSGKKRMGIGILFCSLSLAVAAIVESVRRAVALKEGFADDPEAVVNMSAFWTLPRYIFSGIAEAFNAIGQIEFFYLELPKAMSSIATSLFGLGMSAGNLAASFTITTVDNFSQAAGKESWVSNNINKGHSDYYYWLLCGLNLVNFLYFIACSKSYGPCKEEARNETNGDDGNNVC